ncbi:MAG: mechanosensitive ion channel domain-containing protein [Pseudomonadota bacterium]
MLLSASAKLEALGIEVNDASLTAEDAERIARAATALRTDATRCVTEREAQIKRLESNLLILGDTSEEAEATADAPDDTPAVSPVISEPEAVSERRAAFEQEMAGLRSDVAGCKLAQLRAREISDTALERLSAILAQRLLSYGPRSLHVLRDNLRRPGRALRETADMILTPGGRTALSRPQAFGIGFAGLLGFLFGAGAAALLDRWAEQRRGRGGQPAVEVVYARVLPRWLPILTASLVAVLTLRLFLGDTLQAVPMARLYVALLAFSLAGIVIDWAAGPYSPGSDMCEDTGAAETLRRRGQALAGAIATAYFVFGHGWFATPPSEQGLVLRALITVFVATSIIWLVRSPRFVPALAGRLWIMRHALGLAAIAIVITELLGYRNLANHLMRAALGTIAAGLLLWILLWAIRAVVDGILNGKADVSYRLRNWLGILPNESSAELSWLRLILSVTLWLIFAVTLISLWDSTGNALPKLTEIVTQGIKLSDQYTLVPRDVLRGLLVFGVVIALTAWIKGQLNKRWLRDIGMDRGSRDAIVTLGGYVGFVLAIILGLALAGVDFRGLAFVLATLGVGIGFGLQNIVSNFVSGLILLFERPIKSGDFVSVGEVEGIVKRIRIRSTEIESLDRRNIIVPNSELIATQVTNWVLHDPYGRLTLNVGVAYGSDTERVRDLLEQVAAEHAEVITRGPAPGPRALFMGFGDSALDFELRVWIRNIEKRFGVTSDLNFAIDRAFRKADIEIPFPQRDLHLRSWSQEAGPPDPAQPSASGGGPDKDSDPD